MGPLKQVSSLRDNAKITQPLYYFHFWGQDGKKKMKRSALDICKANRVTIITFKEISMTNPSVQAQPHMLALSRGLRLHWAEG